MNIFLDIIKGLFSFFKALLVFGLLCGFLIFVFSFINYTQKKPRSSTSALKCEEGYIKIKQDCVDEQKVYNDILENLETIEQTQGAKALSNEEIKIHIGPVFDKYMNTQNSYLAAVAFDQSIIKKIEGKKESDLRLLLNIMHYHDNYGDTTYAEFSEGLRDYIIPFIEEKTTMVIKVVKDNDQLNRELISNAFYQFIDVFKTDSKTGEIVDSRFKLKHRNLMIILEQENLS